MPLTVPVQDATNLQSLTEQKDFHVKELDV
jgi:hypothetical protein